MARVLCIEDETEMSQLMGMILSRHGFDTRLALNGREGIHMLQEFVPDVILLDLMMPDMDGWEVYQHLKSDSSTAAIPVVVVTARSQASEKTAALKVAQVDDYLVKPFNPDQLVETVARVLRKHDTHS